MQTGQHISKCTSSTSYVLFLMLHIAFVCRYSTTAILVLSLVLFLPGSCELQCTWGCSSFQEISHGRCRSGVEVATGSNPPNVQACILPGSHELQSTWGCSSFQEISHGRYRSGVEVATGSNSTIVQACILSGCCELQCTWGCSSFQEISHMGDVGVVWR